MQFEANQYHRRSIRLKGYDYSQPGLYYVTLTLQDRFALFGCIEAGVMHLTLLGEIAREEWLRTPMIRPHVELDEFILMPDHMHGIIVICEERNGVERSENNLVGAYSPSTRSLRSLAQGRQFAPTGNAVSLPLAYRGSDHQGIQGGFGETNQRNSRNAWCESVAKELVRARHPGRTRPPANPKVHQRQSATLCGDERTQLPPLIPTRL